MNNLSDDSGVVVVYLAEGGSAPINIGECERFDFPNDRLAACMTNDLTQRTGFIPHFMRAYLHRESGLLFVAIVKHMITPYEPFQFFQASREHVQRALSIFDAETRSRYEAKIRYDFDAPPPPAPEAPAVEGPKAHEGEPRPKPTAENRAMALATQWATDGKPLSVSEIAKAVGCSREHLYRCETFKRLLASHKAPKSPPPRGRKSRETGEFEAWRDDD